MVERRAGPERVDLAVRGMDCNGCVSNVRSALTHLPGVRSAEVYLAAERASVTFDPSFVRVEDLCRAVSGAGYRCTLPGTASAAAVGANGRDEAEGRLRRNASLTRPALLLMAMIAATVLLVVIVVEWLGFGEVVATRVPLWAGALVVIAIGYPAFRSVLRNALRGRIVAHTLMSGGALAALAIGDWVTAALVAVFIRVGDYAESFTTDRARESLRDLTALTPRTARVEGRNGEQEIAVERVQAGDVVIVRPGELIPVDGEVISGAATVDQAAITGEAMPLEAASGVQVFAATVAELGSIRVRAEGVGRDTTFAKVVRQVEEAEANRGETQRLADRFAAWYLPVVALIAVATYLIGGNLLAAVAVTVVACSCAFALATPVAMLASIGAAAKRGLVIKGGRYLEALAAADTLLVDKTGTLTLGRPEIVDVVPLDGRSHDSLLALAAAAERESEHPLARAVLSAAQERGLAVESPRSFEALPGRGVRAMVGNDAVEVGSLRMAERSAIPGEARALADQGKSLLMVMLNGQLAGVLAAADTVRPGVASALANLRQQGIANVELLSGDNEPAVRALAGELGLAYRAELLPEDKIEAVREQQARGRRVVMIGDGVNDAPALAQADVGVAMGAAGTDLALEAADVAVMNDDWERVPELFEIAGRTMRVVRLNIGFTAGYNLIGISLAALGFLPPVFAAALQSIPDLGIMGNSARLLRPTSKRAGAAGGSSWNVREAPARSRA